MTVEAVTIDAYGTLVTLRDPVPSLQEALAARGADLGADEVAEAFRAEVAYYRPRSHEGRDDATLALLRRDCARVFLGPPASTSIPGSSPRRFSPHSSSSRLPARRLRAGRSPRRACGSPWSRTGTSACATSSRGSASRRSSTRSSPRPRPARQSRIRGLPACARTPRRGGGARRARRRRVGGRRGGTCRRPSVRAGAARRRGAENPRVMGARLAGWIALVGTLSALNYYTRFTDDDSSSTCATPSTATRRL